MSDSPTVRIFGQESFLLKTSTVELAVTAQGGMLGPVTFFPEDPAPIRPYAVAPWAEELLPPGTPPMLAALRGDWFCSAFGENVEPHNGKQLPPHGETANRIWRVIAQGNSAGGAWLRLGVDLPLQGGRCEATTMLLPEQSVIYQRHDLSCLTGPINPGHHAMLAFPNVEGAGRLSFSHFAYACTHFQTFMGPDSAGSSALISNIEILDIQNASCYDSSTTDLTRYPSRHGFDDIIILCSDPISEFSWSAVTFPDLGYVWFALRNPKQLSSTMLWFSNGGQYAAPWNKRHLNVMGIEDITGFFDVGLAASLRENSLIKRGIRTYLEPDVTGCLYIPYIQGVARIPSGFDRVAAIDPQDGRNTILLHSASGAAVEVQCRADFLKSGELMGFTFPCLK